jgi:hypothetical protein
MKRQYPRRRIYTTAITITASTRDAPTAAAAVALRSLVSRMLVLCQSVLWLVERAVDCRSSSKESRWFGGLSQLLPEPARRSCGCSCCSGGGRGEGVGARGVQGKATQVMQPLSTDTPEDKPKTGSIINLYTYRAIVWCLILAREYANGATLTSTMRSRLHFSCE